MAGFLAALPAIASIIGTGASLFGGGSKGSETYKKEPAPFEKRQEDLYDLWEAGMLDSNLPERFTQDDAQQRGFFRNYVDRTDQNLGGYVNALRGVGDLIGASKRTGNVGGQPISIMPKSTQPIIDNITNLADKIMAGTETQEGRRLQYGTEMTPNKAFFNYMDYLKGPVFQNQANRYSIPTQEGSAEYEPSFMQRIGDISKMLTPLYNKTITPQYTRPSVDETNRYDPKYYD